MPSAASIAAAVWGHGGSVLDESAEPAHRLSLTRANDHSERVEILPVDGNPLELEVRSADRALAHAGAFFLAMETQGRLSPG